MPTIWGADWDDYDTANHFVIALSPSSCCIHKTSIITWNISLRSTVWSIYIIPARC